MSWLSDKAYSFTAERISLKTCSKVIVGVSGGADSMCLLHAVCSWRAKGIAPIAVHVIHGIRGDEAQRDADFVREQCERLQVPLYIVRADVPHIAHKERCGIEEAGRVVRYQVFAYIRSLTSAEWIFTAHTASDQAETVLFNILRGCGTAGAAGIPPRRGRIVRPLLWCTRQQVEEFCLEYGVSYVNDSTNEDTQYTRNAIRHELLPLMEKIHPSAVTSVIRFADNAAVDEAYLEQVAMDAVNEACDGDGRYRRDRFAEQPEAIRYRMLRYVLSRRNCRSMEERHYRALHRMIDEVSGAVTLPGGFVIKVSDTHIALSVVTQPPALPDPIRIAALPYEGIFGGYCVHISVVTKSQLQEMQNVHNLFFKSTADYDTIQGNLFVRRRQPGDSIHPAGRGVGKTVKALMNELRIPAEERDRFPLVCDDTGVLLLPGFCCDERVRTGTYTKHFLVCLVERLST